MAGNIKLLGEGSRSKDREKARDAVPARSGPGGHGTGFYSITSTFQHAAKIFGVVHLFFQAVDFFGARHIFLDQVLAGIFNIF